MAKTGHPNFVYKISSPWRGTRHTWSITGNHSGSSLSSGDAETFMTGESSPFTLSYAPFMTAGPAESTTYAEFWHQLTGVAYYDGSDSAAVFEADYDVDSPPPDNLLPNGTAFSEVTSPYSVLEACVCLQAVIGLSKTGKPVLVRKFIHGVANGANALNVDGTNTLSLTDGGTAAMQSQSNGDWYGNRVYIAPSGNQPGASDWSAIPGQHQMPRGRRKVTAKAGAAAQSTLLSILEGAAGGALVDAAETFL